MHRAPQRPQDSQWANRLSRFSASCHKRPFHAWETEVSSKLPKKRQLLVSAMPGTRESYSETTL